MGKRVILAAGILGVLFGCGWLAWWIQQEPPAEEPVQIILEDEAARTEFLRAQGQPESNCIAAETVRLPVSVDDAYELEHYLASVNSYFGFMAGKNEYAVKRRVIKYYCPLFFDCFSVRGRFDSVRLKKDFSVKHQLSIMNNYE